MIRKSFEMKIGIITLLDEKNYGNRWQNYAMNILLHSVGIETENIYFWERNAQRNCIREKIKRIMPLKIAYLLHAFSAYQIKDFAMMKRVVKFTRFTKKYMDSHLILVNTYEELCGKFDSSKFDYFAVGSDQVWNPYYVANPIYFLQFVDRKKRVAFMASFGSDEIPEEKISNYKKWILEMSYLSVREPSGADIIKSLTGKHADVFLDPTLLVNKEIWLTLSKKPKSITLPKHYAAIFMFDCDFDKIRHICSNWNIEVLVLNNKKYQHLYSLDPAEMLYVLNNAEMIFTDSFHIMALSIRLNKQFYVFKRTGFEYMFSRLESTLNRLEIMQCIYANQNDISLCPISEDNYERINLELDAENKRFLNTVCDITKKDK